MAVHEQISVADLSSLRIIHYPDPRLRVTCTPFEQIDEDVAALVARMFELMFESRGVGLAAPQVGITRRLFIASPTCSPDDLEVYINPRITGSEGTQVEEEGCLSFPDVYHKVKRKMRVTVEATGLDGKLFTRTVEELHARIIQHEYDHLEGITLYDKMGTFAKMANRNALQHLEQQYGS
jgi:peptide deformylase